MGAVAGGPQRHAHQLCGPGDNFHSENSHVIPALIWRCYWVVQTGAKEVIIWGNGASMREFLHVDDIAAASLHVMELPLEMYQALPSPSSFRVESSIQHRWSWFSPVGMWASRSPACPHAHRADLARGFHERWR